MTDDDLADGPVSNRRTVLKAAGLVGAGALLPVAASASDAATTAESAAEGADWVQDGAGASNSRHLPDGVAPTADPAERWRAGEDYSTGGAAIVDETAYVAAEGLLAVDLASSDEQWRYEPGSPDEYATGEDDTPHFEAPAVADGTVYATLGYGPFDGFPEPDVLVAVDAATGEERWWFDPDGYEQYSAPVVADGVLYTVGQSADGSETLFAVATDGSTRWQRDVTEEASVPAVADGRVHVATADGALALDTASGEQVWQTDLEGEEYTGTTVVAGGRCYVVRETTDGAVLVALDAVTGEERWRSDWTGDDDSTSLSVGAASAESVYVRTDVAGADVAALDAADGTERWRREFELTAEWNPPTRGTALVGGHLYVGSACLDPADGSTVWVREVDRAINPLYLDAVAHGVVVLAGDTEVVAIGGDTGDGGETTTETTDTTGTTEATTEDGTSTTTTTDETTTTSTTTTESGDCDL